MTVQSRPQSINAAEFAEGGKYHLDGDHQIYGDLPDNITVLVEGALILHGNTGANNTLRVRENFCGQNIGYKSTVQAASIEANNVAGYANLISTEGDIHVLGNVLDSAYLDSLKDLLIKGWAATYAMGSWNGELFSKNEIRRVKKNQYFRVPHPYGNGLKNLLLSENSSLFPPQI